MERAHNSTLNYKVGTQQDTVSVSDVMERAHNNTAEKTHKQMGTQLHTELSGVNKWHITTQWRGHTRYKSKWAHNNNNNNNTTQ